MFDNLEDGVNELSNIAGVKPPKHKGKSTSDEDKLLDEFCRRKNKMTRAVIMLAEMGYFVELESERKNLVHLRNREDVMSHEASEAIWKAERAHRLKNQVLKKEVKDIFEKQNARIRKLKEQYKCM